MLKERGGASGGMLFNAEMFQQAKLKNLFKNFFILVKNS